MVDVLVPDRAGCLPLPLRIPPGAHGNPATGTSCLAGLATRGVGPDHPTRASLEHMFELLDKLVERLTDVNTPCPMATWGVFVIAGPREATRLRGADVDGVQPGASSPRTAATNCTSPRTSPQAASRTAAITSFSITSPSVSATTDSRPGRRFGTRRRTPLRREDGKKTARREGPPSDRSQTRGDFL